MSLTLTDIFAGAGGSSTGAIAVPGVEVALAANHWQLAVDVHNSNHPTTDHACVDLHMEDPRNFPRTDILWASPECTKWSLANSKAKALSREMGGDPTLFDDIPTDLETAEQEEINRSRLLMFDVLRFVEHHRYRMVMVENVVDIATQPKYAAAWSAWRRGLDKLGYAFRVVSLNSMHAQLGGLPAPQSRDRLYIVAWPKGEKAPDIDRALRPPAWCSRCEAVVESQQAWKPGRIVGRYRAQYVYACGRCGNVVEPGWLPASHAIDWSLPAERIADRARPLSPKTMARIREGLRRYGGPVHLEAGGNQYDSMDPKHRQHGSPTGYLRAWPVGEPLRTLHTAPTKGLAIPFILDRRGEYRVRDLESPLSTITANETTKALLIPVEGRDGKRASSSHEPMRTQTTRSETGLLVPYYSASETAKPTEYPIGTLTTVDRYALVMDNNHANRARPASEPMPTLTTATTKAVMDGERRDVQVVTDDDVMACRFRMLEPSEIAAGMAFPGDYQWAGTKRERVKLAGNAVTPPAARDLVSVVADALGAA
ncbi:DNA methyltransferase [Enemella dayhoffiae]|uniref:DNA (cytosine-5-)-methyltransferase n=1 Tax=Enemella dayhoffiae TaxID=2016507 RepID=A0A255GLA7_9ACTN|nr:DNA cytosine methyltransferase [Enemella dayhoffiae]OYO16618.1 DNA methyltransferase [Enemella dayhoffiae]